MYIITHQQFQLTLNIDPNLAAPEQGLAAACLPSVKRDMQALLKGIVTLCEEHDWLTPLGLSPQAQQHSLKTLDVFWVNDETIRALNHETRQKDTATDVLSFPQLEAGSGMILPALPEIPIGEIYVSLSWALAHHTEVLDLSGCHAALRQDYEALIQVQPGPGRYLLERTAHGMLHLFGQHHATEADFERMIGYQLKLLRGVYAYAGATQNTP
jgi:ssRNA-specific RNase YbeY (16S rRNA maturation enzyme)